MSGAGDFADRIGIFDDDIGVFAGGIGKFSRDGADSGADKLMEAFGGAGLQRGAAVAIWEFCERAQARASGAGAEVGGGGVEESRVHAMFPAMLVEAVQAPLPRMHLRVLRMALGWADVGSESMRRVADDYKYSPEQISNLVEAVQVKYRLPKNQFNKSAAAVARYQETNGK